MLEEQKARDEELQYYRDLTSRRPPVNQGFRATQFFSDSDMGRSSCSRYPHVNLSQLSRHHHLPLSIELQDQELHRSLLNKHAQRASAAAGTGTKIASLPKTRRSSEPIKLCFCRFCSFEPAPSQSPTLSPPSLENPYTDVTVHSAEPQLAFSRAARKKATQLVTRVKAVQI